VTAPDALAKLDAALAFHSAYCDRLINSAGMGLGGEFLRHAPADLDRLVALNIGALTQLTRHMLPGMIARRRGMILNLASLGGYAPGPYQAAYYASKAYVLSFTEAVAHEVQGRGVVVAVASPGPVRTAFHERMNAQRGLYLKTMPVPSAEATARRIERQLAWGRRVITPGLVPTLLAPAMRVLPHPVSNYIIGTLLKP
jgi:short-subunit dehydrogenase